MCDKKGREAFKKRRRRRQAKVKRSEQCVCPSYHEMQVEEEWEDVYQNLSECTGNKRKGLKRNGALGRESSIPGSGV